MTVQELATLAGVLPHVIRYYVRIGLLMPNRNPVNGYRCFNHYDTERLQFIRLAQQVGYTLKDIKAMLDELASNELSETWVHTTLQERLVSTRSKRRKLQHLERSIEQTLCRYQQSPPQTTDMRGFMSWIETTVEPAFKD